MARDREGRRRGHRRGRREQPPRPPSEERQEETSEASDEGEAPADSPSRFSFRRRRQGEADRTEERGKEPAGRSRSAERPAAAGSAPSASPLSFWRRGQARPYRVQRQLKARSLSRRISGMYIPPWLPVVAIIAVVFGILGLFFFTRSATGAPRTTDHWHADYVITVCGVRQPNVPEFSGGVHTHGGGTIHMHPNFPSEEGSGARLVKWFEYGGGKLTQDEMRIAGQSQTYRNGDLCDDGSEGTLQVFVNGQGMDSWSRYIPQDGDQMRIVFGPEEATQVSTDDGIVIPPEEATREISVESSD